MLTLRIVDERQDLPALPAGLPARGIAGKQQLASNFEPFFRQPNFKPAFRQAGFKLQTSNFELQTIKFYLCTRIK